MKYRIVYQDEGAPISVLPQPGRAAALRKARSLSSDGQRTVYVIGSDETGDIGQRVYQFGQLVDADGATI